MCQKHPTKKANVLNKIETGEHPFLPDSTSYPGLLDGDVICEDKSYLIDGDKPRIYTWASTNSDIAPCPQVRSNTGWLTEIDRLFVIQNPNTLPWLIIWFILTYRYENMSDYFEMENMRRIGR